MSSVTCADSRPWIEFSVAIATENSRAFLLPSEAGEVAEGRRGHGQQVLLPMTPPALRATSPRFAQGGRRGYFTVTKRSGKLLSAGWTRSMFLRAAHTTACWCRGM